MDVRFTLRDDGQVDARLTADRPVLDDALVDCIAGPATARAGGGRASTYWIDQADRRARAAHRDRDDRPFLSRRPTGATRCDRAGPA